MKTAMILESIGENLQNSIASRPSYYWNYVPNHSLLKTVEPTTNGWPDSRHCLAATAEDAMQNSIAWGLSYYWNYVPSHSLLKTAEPTTNG